MDAIEGASPTPAFRSAGRTLSPRAQAWVFGCAGALVALGVWTLLSHVLATGGGVINRLPTPARVLRELAGYVAGDFLRDLMFSLRVFAMGWVVGAVGATVVGLVLGRVRLLGQIFIPVIEAIRPVSSIAWVPLAVVWFGFGLTGKVFLVGLAVFLVVIVYAVDGARRIPPDLDRTASMLGMNGWQRFRSLVVPGTLAEVLIGSRVSLMAGWGTVIVAELVAADSGLGAHLISVEQSYDVPAVMATMLCFGLTGFLMNALFTLLERRLMPWRHVNPGEVAVTPRRANVRGGQPPATVRATEATSGARRRFREQLMLPLVGVAIVLAGWEATVLVYNLPVVVLPSPWAVMRTLVQLLGTGPFWRDVGISLYEFAIGYIVGVVVGIAVGTLMGEWRHFRLAATPVIESLRFIVPFAWIPLTILWFGTSYTGKIALVAYAVFFVMVVSTARAIANVDPVLSRVGTVLGMGAWRLAWTVHLRAAAPTIASGARAAAAIGWIAVVAAEYIGASAGLGLMITNAASSLATAVVIAGMIVIGLVGAGVSALIRWLSHAYLDYR